MRGRFQRPQEILKVVEVGLGVRSSSLSFKDVEVEAELLLTIEPELYELEIKLEGNVGWVISLKV